MHPERFRQFHGEWTGMLTRVESGEVLRRYRHELSPGQLEADLTFVRVATARNMSIQTVTALVDQTIEEPQLGFLGEPRINVLRLNRALDQLR